MENRGGTRRSLALAGLMLAAALTPGGAPGAAGQDFEARVGEAAAYFEDYRRADQLWEQGRAEDAIPVLERLAAGYGRDPLVHYRLGRAHELRGDAGPAIDGYRRALEIGFESRAWISYRIARLFAENARPDSSLAWLRRALDARYEDRPRLAEDEAFASLSEDPRFRELSGQLPDREFTRDDGWRYDLDYLVAEARRMHAAPHRPAFSEEFETAAAELRVRIPDLSNSQILVELLRLVTMLGDGHSAIYGPAEDSPLDFASGSLPVVFYLFDDGLHIVDADETHRRWIGARVLAFGSRPAAAILSELDGYVHHDNPQTHKWLGVHFALRRVGLLEAMGATDRPDQVTLRLRERDGALREVTMEAGDHQFRRRLRPPRDASDPPRWLQHIDRNYSLEEMPALDAVYWQFNRVRDLEDGPSLAGFADSLRAALERSGAKHLVVDVRHNNGGNTNLVEPLLRTLSWWEQEAPEHRIFVIMGRNTFSAAQNFISRLEQRTDAVFVGEPTSSRPNFTGEETGLLLPYSRVRGSISTIYWQNAGPTDERPWIAPHVPITLSSTDYFEGRDPALAAITEIVAAE